MADVGSGIDFPYSIGNYWDYANQSGSPWDTASGSDNSSQGGSPFDSLVGAGGGGGDVGAGIGVVSDVASDASMGSAFGPWGTAAGAAIGLIQGLLGSGLFGGGVPTGAKTQGAQSALEGSGNPLLQMLGAYMQGQGGGNGSNVLSNPAFARQTNTFADVLSWLSGQQLPGYKQMGSTGEIAGIPPPAGAPYTKPVNIMGIQSPAQLNAELGASPDLNAGQIEGLLPQIQQLLAGGGNLTSLKNPLTALAKTAPSASTTGGAAGSGGLNIGGFQFGTEGTGQDELTSILKMLTQRQGQGGMPTSSPWDHVKG